MTASVIAFSDSVLSAATRFGIRRIYGSFLRRLRPEVGQPPICVGPATTLAAAPGNFPQSTFQFFISSPSRSGSGCAQISTVSCQFGDSGNNFGEARNLLGHCSRNTSTMAAYLEDVRASDEKHAKPEGIEDSEYGTAGFRNRADGLDYVMYRVGLIAALRSMATKAVTGIVITASHNPEEDNGVKIVDPMGDMLEPSWEAFSTELVNAKDVADTLEKIIKSANVDINEKCVVFLGKDTRASSEKLAQSAIDGVKALGGTVEDFGLLTTPQLHYLVRCKNTDGGYGEPTEEGYYKKLSEAFCKIRGSDSLNGHYAPKLRLDGANGVGAVAAKKLRPYLNKTINIELCNDGSGRLNHLCGADYVKVHQRPSEGVPLDAGVRCVALDGDADRVIYFYISKAGHFRMLDGDKIAALIAGYISTILAEIELDLNMGLVQTAYANGSATDYISKVMKIPVVCVPTGVKYLHHKALQYDIGVYFEANGHGTVVFSENAKTKIAGAAKDDSLQESQRKAAKEMLNFIDLVNETVGDAICDMLVVETILHTRGWSIEDWDKIYTDLPNRLLKVSVSDRSAIKTTDAARKVVQPPQLQEAIEELVAKYKSARAFVRASGTEDIIRVYSEASTQVDADRLAQEVASKVYHLAGGVGRDPIDISLD